MAAFQFEEMPDSRSATANPPTATLRYRASGDGAETASFVHSFAYNATPAILATVWGNLFRDDIKLEPRGWKLWTVTVPYGKNVTPRESWTWSFDTTGGSFHIKASKGTVNRYGTAPDCKQLIGVHENEVDGADIVIPALKINVNYKHPQGELTLDHAYTIANLTGMVNDGPMLRRAAGEVLFLGGTGSDGTQAEAEAGYQFAISANLQSQVVGAISGINKDGWDIAWIRWIDAIDNGLPVKQPMGVYIERVYHRVDLAAALGFGG